MYWLGLYTLTYFLYYLIACCRKIDLDTLKPKKFWTENFWTNFFGERIFRTSFELIFGQIFRTFWTKPQAINNPKLLHLKTIFRIFKKKLYKNPSRSSFSVVFAV